MDPRTNPLVVYFNTDPCFYEIIVQWIQESILAWIAEAVCFWNLKPMPKFVKKPLGMDDHERGMTQGVGEIPPS